MFSQCNVESPLERGRMMSLSEVLKEMFGFNPNAIDEERNGRKYSTNMLVPKIRQLNNNFYLYVA